MTNATKNNVSGDPDNKGYQFSEASQFIEFCIELDNQDDRMKEPCNPNFEPEIDSLRWNPVPLYDSRQAVAKDVIAYKKTGETAANQGWAKLYQEILKRAQNQPPAAWDQPALAADARYNGFSPYQVAWLLYEGRGPNAGAYAIAIRGTVFSAAPSALEDFIFQPIQARAFLNEHVSFASTNKAVLHSGFAHGTFSLLLDERYGILRILNDLAIADARLFIVGHSQGAAMATLVHAFLHYAMQEASATKDVFHLFSKSYLLKSYAYAQPKPGNFDFSADFAGITQQCDSAIVINNNIDPVPQVPLTLQSLDDLSGDLPGQSWLIKFLQYLAGIPSIFHSLLGKITEPIVRKHAEGYGYYYNYAQLGRLGNETVGGSWCFLPAGHVLWVYGSPGNPRDLFLQHHAWTYRNLIRAQLP